MVREVLHHTVNLDAVRGALFQQLVGNHPETVLDIVCHQTRVGTGNRRRGIGLADGKEVGNVAQIILDIGLCRAPDKQEIVLLGLVPEERRTRHVVVQYRLRLARLDAAKLHKRRLIGGIQNKRLAELGTGDMVVLAVLFAVVVHQQGAHAEVRQEGRVLFRVLAQHKVACVLQRQVARAVQHLAGVLGLFLAVFLARRAHLGKGNGHVGRELDQRTVPRARLVLCEAHLVKRQLQLDRRPRVAHDQLTERLTHTVAMLLAQLVHAVVGQIERIELGSELARFEQVWRRICTQQRHLLLLLCLFVLENHVRIVHVHNKAIKGMKTRVRIPNDALEKVGAICKLCIPGTAYIFELGDMVARERLGVLLTPVALHDTALPVVDLDVVHEAARAFLGTVCMVVVKLDSTAGNHFPDLAFLKARLGEARNDILGWLHRARCVDRRQRLLTTRRGHRRKARSRAHLRQLALETAALLRRRDKEVGIIEHLARRKVGEDL